MRSRPQGFEAEESPEQDMGPTGSSLQQEIAEVEKEGISEEATSLAFASSEKLFKALNDAEIIIITQSVEISMFLFAA